MIEKLLELDKKLFIFLNGFHSPVLDPVMLFITKTEFWIPLYAFLIFLMFKNFKREAWFLLIGAAITILLADQITSSLMKPYFERLRPSQDPSMQNFIHLVHDYRGGLYGFASSHAANTFGVALLVWLSFRTVYNWVFLMFLWAAAITYTRIYLGVHYPGDIIAGALVGLVSGWVGFKASEFLRIRYKKTPTVA